MTRKKLNIGKDDFDRYLQDKMSNSERNDFERALQQHPFEAEALEGFETISPGNIQSDLSEIGEKLKPKKRKRMRSYFAVAATFLLLVTAGVIWNNLSDRTVVQEVAEMKPIDENDESYDVAAPLPVPAPETKKEEAKSQNLKRAENTEPKKSAFVQEMVKPNKRTTAQPDSENAVQKEPESGNVQYAKIESQAREEPEYIRQKEKEKQEVNEADEVFATQVTAAPLPVSKNEGRFIRGKIISSADSLPLAGAAIVAKGSGKGIVADENGNFELKVAGNDKVVASFIGMEPHEFDVVGDSDYVIALQPEQLALDEVAVIGFGRQKKKNLTSSVSPVTTHTANEAATPVAGMENYRKYLNEQAVLPADYRQNRVVVKLIFTLNPKGEITGFENKNRADSTLFERAKKIVLDGPEWFSKTENSKRVNSTVELKIVFRKK